MNACFDINAQELVFISIPLLNMIICPILDFAFFKGIKKINMERMNLHIHKNIKVEKNEKQLLNHSPTVFEWIPQK